MPIYEYRCRECGGEFETILFRQEDERDISCPECGRKYPERLMSAFASCAASPSAGKACTQFQ